MRQGFAKLALAVIVALSCASGGGGDSEDREVILATEYDDHRAGAEGAQAIEAEMGLLDDPTIVAYVNAIGERLQRYATSRTFGYTFQVVDQTAPNAFALPGGHIYVSRGLLALVNSEDELANVIGHEITHAAARHSASLQRRAQTLNPLVMGYMRHAALAKHSRDQERDADRGGQTLAAAAGFDPMGMPKFLKDLDAVERLTVGWSRLPNFFATHPTTPERMATAVNRAETLEWKRATGIAHNRTGLLGRLDGLTLGPNPEEGVFEGTRFLHPDLGFTLRFPEGWELFNSHQAVGAISPNGDVQLTLTLAGRGDDPEVAAREFIAKRAPELRTDIERTQTLEIGGLKAFRLEGTAQTPNGSAKGHITWIAFDGLVYEISSFAPSRVAASYLGRTRSVARSFRAMTDGERDIVQVVRLRIERSRRGETLGVLLARSDNTLDPNFVAVSNDLYLEQKLVAGTLIKIGIAEPYVPKAVRELRLTLDEEEQRQRQRSTE